MPNSVAMNDMIELFRKELVLCGVKDATTVAVLSEVDRLADYAAGFMTAAQDLGAQAYNVNLLPSRLNMSDKFGNVGMNALAGNRPAIESLVRRQNLLDKLALE